KPLIRGAFARQSMPLRAETMKFSVFYPVTREQRAETGSLVTAFSSEAHRTVGALARRRRFLSRCPQAKITWLTRAAWGTVPWVRLRAEVRRSGLSASLSARGPSNPVTRT